MHLVKGASVAAQARTKVREMDGELFNHLASAERAKGDHLITTHSTTLLIILKSPSLSLQYPCPAPLVHASSSTSTYIFIILRTASLHPRWLQEYRTRQERARQTCPGLQVKCQVQLKRRLYMKHIYILCTYYANSLTVVF